MNRSTGPGMSSHKMMAKMSWTAMTRATTQVVRFFTRRKTAQWVPQNASHAMRLGRKTPRVEPV